METAKDTKLREGRSKVGTALRAVRFRGLRDAAVLSVSQLSALNFQLAARFPAPSLSLARTGRSSRQFAPFAVHSFRVFSVFRGLNSDSQLSARTQAPPGPCNLCNPWFRSVVLRSLRVSPRSSRLIPFVCFVSCQPSRFARNVVWNSDSQLSTLGYQLAAVAFRVQRAVARVEGES